MMIQSMRFNPDWSPYSGQQVCGLIELIYDVNQLSNNKDLNCVEIGSYNGESSLLISSFPFVKKLYCVDISINNMLCSRLSHKVGSGHLHIVNALSTEFAKSIPDNSIDMVYIDGDHSYDGALQDLKVWYPKIIHNGFITGHDYGSAHPGVIEAVNTFISEYNLSIYKTYMDTSFCIIKKSST